jgi:hypothetical protein
MTSSHETQTHPLPRARFERQNLNQVMRVFPSTKNEWLALVLFPFKAYVVIVWPFYFLFNIFYPQPLTIYLGNNTTVWNQTAERFLEAFGLCGPLLMLGLIIQLFARDEKSAIRTLMFAIVPSSFFCVWLFIGMVQHML